MRRTLAAIVVASALAVAACGGDGDDRGSEPASSTKPRKPASAKTLTAADVRKAASATRAAGTARYRASNTTLMGPGMSMSVDQLGSFDLRRKLGSVTQYISGNPEVFEALGAGSPSELSTQMVYTASASYLQMDAWPAPMKGRWIKYTEKDFSKLGLGEVALGDVLPGLVSMLDHARPAPGRKADGRLVPVLVDAEHAFNAFPTTSTRKLVEKGVDPADLKGDQLVEVYIDDKGRVGEVSLEADALFDQAYQLAGLPKDAADLSSHITAEISLEDYGKPVKITVPSGKAVATPEELAGIDG